MLTNWMRFSDREALSATPNAARPQKAVKARDKAKEGSLDQPTKGPKSITVVADSALSSALALDMAPLKITANRSPSNPAGKLFRAHPRKT